ncbi:helix-turn-helix domain-containing protein [Anaerofustis stercorihominis]|uniref:helix-turn-helix domain-containing protein n=1 Tax=Anaerofustis stercorihominis TaxID=214853 RepID=UPI00210D3B2F|nr:helix-turn-helix domain-containing protein [Anaerofustis stercorihominis]MCQ4794866.1 helix-turn-helix domain-containing protein [Anaerofustis stercorihominis]
MKDENMRFGAYIKSKRLKDERELTLKDMSKVLGLSLSLLSDIEQGRRKPFGSDKIEKFCEYLQLSDADKALMYDLAARETGDIPSDLDDIMMHSEVGNMARMALRMTNAGVADEEDWKQFIREIEKKRGTKFD